MTVREIFLRDTGMERERPCSRKRRFLLPHPRHLFREAVGWATSTRNLRFRFDAVGRLTSYSPFMASKMALTEIDKGKELVYGDKY